MLYIYKMALTPKMMRCCMDAQEMHKFLCSLVHSDRKGMNLLYKLDAQNGYLLVQSDIRPDETKHLMLCHEVDYDTMLSKKKAGDWIHFHLTTDTKWKDHATNKKHYVPHDQVIPWITEKLKRYGVEPSLVDLVQKRDIKFTHKREEKGGRGDVTLYEFDVMGTITDIEKLKDVWHTGMGCHKAYGNGMFVMNA